MEKIEFVQELRKFTQSQGITYQEYFENYARRLRSHEKIELTSWELKNPFIKEDDIKTILYAADDQVCSAFGTAMATVVAEFEKTIPVVSRKDMEDAINEHVDALARGEIVEAVEEKLAEREEVVEPLELKATNRLNGFAVLKEEKTDRVHVYYFEGGKDGLMGETLTKASVITVDSGYYVNFEQAIYQILEPIVEKHPDLESVRFVREDGEERTKTEFLEEMYQILVQRGALRFGKEIEKGNVNSFETLMALPKEETKYKGYSLQSGLYVRRDILLRVFSKFKARITIKKEEKATVK